MEPPHTQEMGIRNRTQIRVLPLMEANKARELQKTEEQDQEANETKGN